jgi:hypothetical protein
MRLRRRLLRYGGRVILDFAAILITLGVQAALRGTRYDAELHGGSLPVRIDRIGHAAFAAGGDDFVLGLLPLWADELACAVQLIGAFDFVTGVDAP